MGDLVESIVSDFIFESKQSQALQQLQYDEQIVTSALDEDTEAQLTLNLGEKLEKIVTIKNPDNPEQSDIRLRVNDFEPFNQDRLEFRVPVQTGIDTGGDLREDGQAVIQPVMTLKANQAIISSSKTDVQGNLITRKNQFVQGNMNVAGDTQLTSVCANTVSISQQLYSTGVTIGDVLHVDGTTTLSGDISLGDTGSSITVDGSGIHLRPDKILIGERGLGQVGLQFTSNDISANGVTVDRTQIPGATLSSTLYPPELCYDQEEDVFQFSQRNIDVSGSSVTEETIYQTLHAGHMKSFGVFEAEDGLYSQKETTLHGTVSISGNTIIEHGGIHLADPDGLAHIETNTFDIGSENIRFGHASERRNFNTYMRFAAHPNVDTSTQPSEHFMRYNRLTGEMETSFPLTTMRNSEHVSATVRSSLVSKGDTIIEGNSVIGQATSSCTINAASVSIGTGSLSIGRNSTSNQTEIIFNQPNVQNNETVVPRMVMRPDADAFEFRKQRIISQVNVDDGGNELTSYTTTMDVMRIDGGDLTLTTPYRENQQQRSVTLKPSLDMSSNDISFVLPAKDGTDGQVLMTDGQGNLSFTDMKGGSLIGGGDGGTIDLSGFSVDPKLGSLDAYNDAQHVALSQFTSESTVSESIIALDTMINQSLYASPPKPTLVERERGANSVIYDLSYPRFLRQSQTTYHHVPFITQMRLALFEKEEVGEIDLSGHNSIESWMTTTLTDGNSIFDIDIFQVEIDSDVGSSSGIDDTKSVRAYFHPVLGDKLIRSFRIESSPVVFAQHNDWILLSEDGIDVNTTGVHISRGNTYIRYVEDIQELQLFNETIVPGNEYSVLCFYSNHLHGARDQYDQQRKDEYSHIALPSFQEINFTSLGFSFAAPGRPGGTQNGAIQQLDTVSYYNPPSGSDSHPVMNPQYMTFDKPLDHDTDATGINVLPLIKSYNILYFPKRNTVRNNCVYTKDDLISFNNTFTNSDNVSVNQLSSSVNAPNRIILQDGEIPSQNSPSIIQQAKNANDVSENTVIVPVSLAPGIQYEYIVFARTIGGTSLTGTRFGYETPAPTMIETMQSSRGELNLSTSSLSTNKQLYQSRPRTYIMETGSIVDGKTIIPESIVNGMSISLPSFTPAMNLTPGQSSSKDIYHYQCLPVFYGTEDLDTQPDDMTRDEGFIQSEVIQQTPSINSSIFITTENEQTITFSGYEDFSFATSEQTKTHNKLNSTPRCDILSELKIKDVFASEAKQYHGIYLNVSSQSTEVSMKPDSHVPSSSPYSLIQRFVSQEQYHERVIVKQHEYLVRNNPLTPSVPSLFVSQIGVSSGNQYYVSGRLTMVDRIVASIQCEISNHVDYVRTLASNETVPLAVSLRVRIPSSTGDDVVFSRDYRFDEIGLDNSEILDRIRNPVLAGNTIVPTTSIALTIPDNIFIHSNHPTIRVEAEVYTEDGTTTSHVTHIRRKRAGVNEDDNQLYIDTKSTQLIESYLNESGQGAVLLYEFDPTTFDPINTDTPYFDAVYDKEKHNINIRQIPMVFIYQGCYTNRIPEAVNLSQVFVPSGISSAAAAYPAYHQEALSHRHAIFRYSGVYRNNQPLYRVRIIGLNYNGTSSGTFLWRSNTITPDSLKDELVDENGNPLMEMYLFCKNPPGTEDRNFVVDCLQSRFATITGDQRLGALLDENTSDPDSGSQLGQDTFALQIKQSSATGSTLYLHVIMSTSASNHITFKDIVIEEIN